MVTRQGMGKGQGKGFKNIIGKDPMVHSQSAKGMKQPQKVPPFVQNILRGIKRPKTKTNTDDVDNILEDIGVKEKPKSVKNLPEGLTEIKFDPSVEGEVSGAKRLSGQVQARAGSLFKKGSSIVSQKLKEKKEADEKAKEESLSLIKHPKVKEIEKQRARVEHLKESIDNEPDREDEEDLFEELEREQKQLAELHEDFTKINLQDVDDKDLKVLAVRYKPSGLASFFEFSNNPYEEELIRRIEVRKKIAEEIKEAKKKPVEDDFFSF
jgi:hypothetical protein